jgi:hypothetical protein
MKYAIPSYARENVLFEKTWKMLKYYEVGNDEIIVFVANQEELKRYKELFPEDLKFVVGVKGMWEIREFMKDYFEEGERVVYIDDDIEKIEYLNDNNEYEVLDDLKAFCIRGFMECDKINAKNWGINAVKNKMFQGKAKQEIATGLNYIMGGFYGVINDRECEERLVSHGEDYERSIRYYLKYGNTIRFNRYSAKTKNFAEGGMEAEFNGKRKEIINRDLTLLKTKYPNLFYLKQKKEYLNPVLKDMRKGEEKLKSLEEY